MPFNHIALPERVVPVLNDLAFQFLTPQPGTAINRNNPFEKGGSQVGTVFSRRHPRNKRILIVQNGFQQPDWPGCCRNDLSWCVLPA